MAAAAAGAVAALSLVVSGEADDSTETAWLDRAIDAATLDDIFGNE